jgi:Xaa-Pro aminopeptidase
VRRRCVIGGRSETLYARHPFGLTVAASERWGRLRAAWPGDVDAVLLTHLVNVRWAAGFTGTAASLLVSRDPGRDAVIATDERYRLRVAEECPDVELRLSRRPAIDLLADRGAESPCRLGIEADHVTLSEFAELQAVAAGHPVELVALAAVVEPLRASKDDEEIAALTAACAATDAAFGDVLGRLRPGLTESEVEWMLTAAMRAAGAEGSAFDAIVASGPHAAVPHHRPGSRQLVRGDLLTMDFGAVVDGQHADMTRTVVVGRPSGWQQDLHEVVTRIQEEVRGMVRPGMAPDRLDDAARDRILTAGHDVAHGVGHGVGLEVHEEPWLTPGSTSAELVAGVCLTIEPGIYLEGRGGVRVEDTLLVTPSGAESLTGSDRSLIQV